MKNSHLEEHYDRLRDLFHENIPDQEFLEEDEDTSETVEMLYAYQVEDYLLGCEIHLQFMYEWFPDGLPEEEQEELRAFLKQVQEDINLCKK